MERDASNEIYKMLKNNYADPELWFPLLRSPPIILFYHRPRIMIYRINTL
jgi:hypothetical protein